MKITVFTPTYNRAYSLPRLYESLKKQTFRDFEWIIVDDGSTDNTKELISEMINKKPFFGMQYLKTENGGKHRAINRGISFVQGELILLMDSDDWLREDALEWIDRIENSIPEKEKENFAGVQGLRCHSDGTIIGRTFEGKICDCTSIERKHYGIYGDKAEVYYTEVLKRYPFPEIEGEKFATERLVWSRIAADGYRIRYFNEKIYFCEYLPDGLTHGGNALYAKNPKQWGMAIHLDYETGDMDWYNSTIQFYIYYLWMKKTISIKEMAVNISVSSFEFRFAIVLQKIADICRRILSNGQTVKSNVYKEKMGQSK